MIIITGIVALAESESIANETLQADALTSVSFTGSATDARLAYSGASGSRLNYSWSILSSQCGMATISNSTSATPVLSLLDVGSFVVRSHRFSFFSFSFLFTHHRTRIHSCNCVRRTASCRAALSSRCW